MFNADFYPTSYGVFEKMMEGETIKGKVFFDPECGKADIVKYLQAAGADTVIGCEINEDLRKIAANYCTLIERDFLNVTSDKISHIDHIVMNPPFSADDQHIVHAYNIAPPGCRITALCNSATIANPYSKTRKQLVSIIDLYGRSEELGNCFDDAERKTNVKVSLIKLHKPGGENDTEFDGFFMEDDPEEEQANSIMSYNVVRDLVNRYVAAVKLFDEQLFVGVKMSNLTSSFFNSPLAFSVTENNAPKTRAEFKTDLQKAGWNFIFEKMNMQKYATQGLRDDINKFVHQQKEVPFTMRNIYRMLEIVIGTQSQRMDKALLEVFDKVTARSHENRYGLPGWKTNSHFLLTETFILDCMIDNSYKYDLEKPYFKVRYGGSRDTIEDLQKALCYITGMNYDDTTPLSRFVSDLECKWGQWYSWGFFEIKGYKKGTMHFKFQNKELWGKFNQHIARIKGYPLFEGKEQTDFQKRQTGRKTAKQAEMYV